METATLSALTDFKQHGFAVIPDILSAGEVAAWRKLVSRHLAAARPVDGHAGPYFLWPALADDPELLRLYDHGTVHDKLQSLLRPGLLLPRPETAQLAITIPPHPRHPGALHVDGLTPTEADGRPGTFTMLAGLLLTDQRETDRGNLWVWPGTHLRAANWLKEHGPDALRGALPYPPVELSEPVQVTGAAGSLVLVHYLLAHNIGGHFGTALDERRETVYFRLRADGHRDRWREVVTEPLLEFA